MAIKLAEIPGRWHQLATVRTGIFWGAVFSLPGYWDGLRDVLPWWGYVGGGVAVSASIAAARLLRWNAADDEGAA